MSTKHQKHHSAVEHKAENSIKEVSEGSKILGFGVNTILLLAVLVIATALVSTWAGFSLAQNTTDTTVQPVVTNTVNSGLLSKEVETYINANLLAQQGVTAKITGAKEMFAGFFEMPFEIIQDGKVVSSGNVYSTKEKLFLVQQAFDLNTPVPQAQPQEPAAEVAPVKTDKPKVDLYVMSFCPYGNKAEDTLKPVFELLKAKIDFNLHFIVSVSGTTVDSLHGAPEVAQDEREACVLKYYGNQAWFDFAGYVNTNCGSASSTSCWEAGATALKLDKAKISTCVTSEGVALMKLHEAASNAANASGSPTMLINGVSTTSVYSYGNSEAYKTAICNAFNVAPTECSTVLSGTTASAAGGSC